MMFFSNIMEVAQAAEPVSKPAAEWWENLGLWTVIAAFAGFTLGNLIKFSLDLLLDFNRRKHSANSLALALRAELMLISHSLYMMTRMLSTGFVASAQLNTDRINLSTLVSFIKAHNIPRIVFEARIGDLGLLGADLSARIVHFYGITDNIIIMTAELSGHANKQQCIEILGSTLDALNSSWKNIEDLVTELSDIAQVERPKVEHFDWEQQFAKAQDRVHDLMSRLSIKE